MTTTINKKNKGGTREGSGRKKTLPTKPIRVPLILVENVSEYIDSMKVAAMNDELPLGTHEPRIQLFLITPELAQKWLSKKNPNNRKIKKSNIDYLTNEILHNRWKVNGETIKFRSDGQLGDGHHRLLAIIAANKAVESLVAFNVTNDALETVDTGLKRTGADMAHILGYEPSKANTFGTAVGWIYRYEHSTNMKSVRISNSTYKEEAESNTDLKNSIEYIHEFPRNGRILTVGILSFLHYEMARIDKKLANIFIEKIVQGVNLETTDIEFKVRKTLLNDVNRTTRMSTLEKIGLIIKAWNSIRKGKPIKHERNIKWRKGEDFPRIQ